MAKANRAVTILNRNPVEMLHRMLHHQPDTQATLMVQATTTSPNLVRNHPHLRMDHSPLLTVHLTAGHLLHRKVPTRNLAVGKADQAVMAAVQMHHQAADTAMA